MAKNFKRMLATTLVMSMLVSALPMQALAAEDGVVTEGPYESVVDGLTVTTTTTTTTTTDSSNNSTTVTVEFTETASGTSDSTGATVESSSSSTVTTVTDNSTNTVVSVTDSSASSSTTQSSSTTVDPATGNTTVTETEVVEQHEKNEDDSTRDFQETHSFSTTTDASGKELNSEWSVDGQENTTSQIPVDNVTVQVPSTDVDDPATKETENSNTVTFGGEASSSTTGDLKNGDDDTEYNQTTTTVTPGKVTITTTDVNFSKVVEKTEVDEDGNVIKGNDLDYVYNKNKPVNGENDNELIIWVFRGSRTELPKEGEEIVVKDGYGYKYLGSGNTSQYIPVYLYGEAQESEEDELVYVDAEGNTYYIPASQGTAYYDEVYYNGEWIKLEESVPATFSTAQQFTLVDAATGELITAYCADVTTPTVKDYNYFIQNLEDATYYTEEQAAMIRTIAKNGYWGTASGETGSLDTMKESLGNAVDADGNNIFTQEELAMLTDGLALTATQMAIWTYSNRANDMHFFSALYTNEPNKDGELKTSWASQLVNKSADKDASYALMYKLYNYMINLAPTPVPTDKESGKPTTAGTIIHEKNFLEDMSVTVIKKDEAHANNTDDNDDNDAYVTNLTFALVVQPSTENGDDLVVSVVDANNNVIASGRIAGTAAEGENVLIPDADGNYCFSNITMIEGEQNFKLNLTGIQHLKEGVYLYTSEIRENTPSQTLVGIASGDHSVNVTMDIVFELDVDEGVVATEQVWHYEGDPSNGDEEPPTPMSFEPEEDPEVPAPMVFRLNNQEGLTEIPEEPVPLAAPVVTGDNSGLWMAIVMFALFGMVAINLSDKKHYTSF